MGNTALCKLILIGVCMFTHGSELVLREAAEFVPASGAVARGAGAGVLLGAAAQAAVALRAATVHRLHQHTVDLLAQLGHVRGHAAHLIATRGREHILIQWTPAGGEIVHLLRGY